MPKPRKRYKLKKKPQPLDNPGFFGDRPRRVRTPEEKREYLKLFLFLITWIIFLTGIYMVCLQLQFEYIMPAYFALGVILFGVWLIFNGGFKKPDIDKIEKPEETSYEDFCAFIDKLKERQRKSKYFLVLFIPFPMIMLVDYVIIVWGERLAR
jgi:maltodextrin utilization protein YvdJ